MSKIERFTADYQPKKIDKLRPGLEQIESIITPAQLAFLSGIHSASLVEITDYQSPDFVSGRSDGLLAELVIDDDTRYYIMAQEVNNVPITTAVKVTRILTEVMNINGSIETYEGAGHLEEMMAFMIEALGQEIDIERFSNLI